MSTQFSYRVRVFYTYDSPSNVDLFFLFSLCVYVCIVSLSFIVNYSWRVPRLEYKNTIETIRQSIHRNNRGEVSTTLTLRLSNSLNGDRVLTHSTTQGTTPIRTGIIFENLRKVGTRSLTFHRRDGDPSFVYWRLISTGSDVLSIHRSLKRHLEHLGFRKDCFQTYPQKLTFL